MSKLRTGPIFTHDVLDHLTKAMVAAPDEEDTGEAVFHEKTHGLQRFLQHGMSRFSIESLKQVLDTLVMSNSSTTEALISLRSLAELRTVVKMIMMKKEAGSLKATDASALMYMENFFYAIFCMTEAKRMFDEIYGDLYFCYYDPDYASRQATRVASSKPGQAGADGLKTREDYSQFGISTLDQLTGSTEHKLRHTVKDMQDILNRWTDLLTDEEPHPSTFEPESEQDLLLLRTATNVEPVLRILPDMFAKFYKSLELAKQWWVLAHEMYPDLPFQRRPSVASSASSSETVDTLVDNGDLTQSEKTTNIRNEIIDTKAAIEENTTILQSLQDEMGALEKREEKFEILMETYEQVGDDIEMKKKEKLSLLGQREKLSANNDVEELELTDIKLRQVDNGLKMLEFQHALLGQDYMIQLEVRPSIIRFQGEVTARMIDMQSLLEKQSANLEKLTQRLEDVGQEEVGGGRPRRVAWNDEDSEATLESSGENTEPDQSRPGTGTPLAGKPEIDREVGKKHVLNKSNSKRFLGEDVSIKGKKENTEKKSDYSSTGSKSQDDPKQCRKLSLVRNNGNDNSDNSYSTNINKSVKSRSQTKPDPQSSPTRKDDKHSRKSIAAKDGNVQHGSSEKQNFPNNRSSLKTESTDTARSHPDMELKKKQPKPTTNIEPGNNKSSESIDFSQAKKDVDRTVSKAPGTSKVKDKTMLSKSKSSKDVISQSLRESPGDFRQRSLSDPFVIKEQNAGSPTGKRNSLKPSPGPLSQTRKSTAAAGSEMKQKKYFSPVERVQMKPKSVPNNKQRTHVPLPTSESVSKSIPPRKNSTPQASAIAKPKEGQDLRETKDQQSHKAVAGSKDALMAKRNSVSGDKKEDRIETKKKRGTAQLSSIQTLREGVKADADTGKRAHKPEKQHK